MSARVPGSVHSIVTDLAAATGWNESRCTVFLLSIADAAMHGRKADVSNAAANVKAAAAVWVKIQASKEYVRSHRASLGAAMACAVGAPPPKDVPPELAS